MENATLRYHDVVMILCDVEGGGYVGPCGIGDCISSVALLTARTRQRYYRYREAHRFPFRILPNDEAPNATEDLKYKQRPILYGENIRFVHTVNQKALTVQQMGGDDVGTQQPAPKSLSGSGRNVCQLCLDSVIDPTKSDNHIQTFRVLPAGNVRAEGNAVLHGDEVILAFDENRTTVAVVPGAVTERLGVAFHNIVLNPRKQSIFTLEAFDCTPVHDLSIRVGMPVMFYNKVAGCMVSLSTQKSDDDPDIALGDTTGALGATGPLLFENDPFGSPGLDLRVSGTQRFLTNVPADITMYGDISTTSVQTFTRKYLLASFLFSFESIGVYGGPINDYSQYRIRHMPTNRFLTLAKRFKSGGEQLKELLYPTLTEDISDPATCFKLHTCNASSGGAASLDVRFYYSDLVQIENAHFTGVWLETHMNGVDLVCTRIRHFEQTFELMRPNLSQPALVQEALRPYPAICQYLQTRHPSLRAMAMHSLIELIYFLTQDKEVYTNPCGPTTKMIPEERQDVLVQCNAHILILKLLEYFSRGKQPEGLSVCFRALTLMIQQRPENAALLSPFVDFLVSSLEGNQTDVKEQVSATILELYTDNLSLLSTLEPETAHKFIQALVVNRDPRYAGLLVALCVYRGEGYQRNQGIVAHELFELPTPSNPNISHILPTMTYEREQVWMTMPPTAKVPNPPRLSLSQIEEDHGQVEYIESVLELLAAVCKGNKTSCVVVNEMRISDILRHMLQETKSKALKAAALACFVEVNISSCTPRPMNVQSWLKLSSSCIDAPLVSVKLTQEQQTSLEFLKSWANTEFKALLSMTSMDAESWNLVRALARALYQMARVGSYEDAQDCRSLAVNCLRLLDHRQEKETDDDGDGSSGDEGSDDDEDTGYIMVTSANKQLVSARIELLRILNVLLHQCAMRYAIRALVSFKQQAGSVGQHHNKRQQKTSSDMNGGCSLYDVEKLLEEMKDSTTATTSHIHPSWWMGNLAQYLPILMEVCRYHKSSFVEESLNVLFRVTDLPRFVYETLCEMTILDTEYLDLSYEPILEKVSALTFSVNDACANPNSIAEQLQELCLVLSGSSVENQKLMRACNIVSCLQTLLVTKTFSIDIDGAREMYHWVSKIMVLYCSSNLRHQHELEPFIPRLLSLLDHGFVCCGLFDALAEIYRGNEVLLHELDDTIIARVFDLSHDDPAAVVFFLACATHGHSEQSNGNKKGKSKGKSVGTVQYHLNNLGLFARHIKQPHCLTLRSHVNMNDITSLSIPLNDGEYHALQGKRGQMALHMKLLELCSAMVRVGASPVHPDFVLDLASQPLSTLPMYYKHALCRCLLHFVETGTVVADDDRLTKLVVCFLREVQKDVPTSASYMNKWGKYKLRGMMALSSSTSAVDDKMKKKLTAFSSPERDGGESTAHTASTHFYGKRQDTSVPAKAEMIALNAPDYDDEALVNRNALLDRKTLSNEHKNYIWHGMVPLILSLWRRLKKLESLRKKEQDQHDRAAAAAAAASPARAGDNDDNDEDDDALEMTTVHSTTHTMTATREATRNELSTNIVRLAATILNESSLVEALDVEKDHEACVHALQMFATLRKQNSNSYGISPQIASRFEELLRSLDARRDVSVTDRAFHHFCGQFFIAAAENVPFKRLIAVARDTEVLRRQVFNTRLPVRIHMKLYLLITTLVREYWNPNPTLDIDDSHRQQFLKELENKQIAVNSTEAGFITQAAFESLENDDLRAPALRCMIGLLNKGNRTVQRTILEYLKAQSGMTLMVIRKHLQMGSMKLYQMKKMRELEGATTSTATLSSTLYAQELVCFEMCTLMRFLQLLCEGHNAQLQNRLRHQPEKKNSVNVVKDICNVFSSWTQIISPETMCVGIQALKSLTEFCQGPCVENQAELVDSGIATIVGNIILAKEPHLENLHIEHADIMHELTSECVNVLAALTEGLMSTSSVPQVLLRVIPTDDLLSRLNELFVKGRIVDHFDNVSPFVARQAIEGKYRDPKAPTGDDEEEEEAFDGINYDIDAARATELIHVASNQSEALWMIAEQRCPEKLVEEDDGDEPYPKATQLGLDLFMYMLALSRFDIGLRRRLEMQMSYEYFFQRVGVIEIRRIDLENRLERVYFAIPRRCDYLLEHTKKQFTEDVDRTDISTKLNALMDSYEDIIVETNIYAHVAKNAYVGIFVKHSFKIEMVSLALALTISLFLMFEMDKANSSTTFFLSDKMYAIFQTMSFIQLFLEFWMFIGWMAVNGKVYFERTVKITIRKIERKIGFGDDSEETRADLRRWQNFTKKPILWQIREGVKMFSRFQPFWISLAFAAAEPLGLLVNPIFFSIQIFRVVKYSVALQNVVSAVTLRANELMQAGFFATLVIFLFSVVSFLEFRVKYYEYHTNNELGTGFNCESLAQCFLIVLVYGIRKDGGIGYRLLPPDWYDDGRTWARLTYDFLFWMILVVIFLNIIFGIILDTFAELRDRRQDRLKDMATTCFICGLEAHMFDRFQGTSFVKHYKEEHNQWDYVRFFHHLTLKQKTEFTGQESYVAERLRRKDTSFIPTEKAISIETTDSVDESRDKRVLASLNRVHDIYNHRLTELIVNEKQRQATAALSQLAQGEAEAIADEENIADKFFATGMAPSRPATEIDNDSVVPDSVFDYSTTDDNTTFGARQAGGGAPPQQQGVWELSTDDGTDSSNCFVDEEKEGFLTNDMREKLLSDLKQLMERNHQRASVIFNRAGMNNNGNSNIMNQQ